MRRRLPDATVDSLGWLDWRYPPREHEQHVELDLNEAQTPERLPELDRYDLVVAAEVLEHLYTAPTLVLRYLASALEPRGVLIVQTPNAVALKKRLHMLRGRNPAEPIREERMYAGHFHEYTPAELRDAAHAAGLEVESCVAANYFRTGSRKNAVYARLERWLPTGLRDGITAVLVPANRRAPASV
jgi:trans-aconitate methyltransferase